MSIHSHAKAVLERAAKIPSEEESMNVFRSLCSTSEGAQWLSNAIDPMHDRGVVPIGMPDMESGQSVILKYERSLVFDANSVSGHTPGNTVDVLIQHAGMIQAQIRPGELLYNPPANFVDIQATAGVFAKLPFLSLRARDTGADLSLYNFPDQILDVWTGDTNPVAYSSYEFPEGKVRVVSASIEVENTSPELYLSGSVLAYTDAQIGPERHACFALNEAATVGESSYCDLYQSGPRTLAQARLMPATQSHDARDGAYMPINLGFVNSHASVGKEHCCYAFTDFVPSTLTTPTVINVQVDNTTNHGLNGWCIKSGCPNQGLYFTGLNENTSLVVSLRVIVELFPSIGNTTYQPLVKPSPIYDPQALAAYHLLKRTTPIMATFDENGFGGFLRNVLSSGRRILRITKPIANFIPGGNAVYNAGKQIIDSGDKVLDAADVVGNLARKASKSKTRKQLVDSSKNILNSLSQSELQRLRSMLDSFAAKSK
jgi:hypothetical protein